jgi:hypothetical protein
MNVLMSDSGIISLTTIANPRVTLDSQVSRTASFLRQRKPQYFDVFLTVDQGIEYQQNLTGRSIGIIVFRTKSNRLKDLLPHVPACLAQIESIQPGDIARIQGSANLSKA